MEAVNQTTSPPANNLLHPESAQGESLEKNSLGLAGSVAEDANPNQRTGVVTGAGPRLGQSLDLATPDAGLNDSEKADQILKLAGDAFAQTGSWVVFYRAVLGPDGVARRTFPTEATFEAFERMPQHGELQEMLAAMRSQDTSKGDSIEPEKMITIRLPESLHRALTNESNAMALSINKLCISKLLQPVEGRYVPVQQGRRRGRKPGPQGSRKKKD